MVSPKVLSRAIFAFGEGGTSRVLGVMSVTSDLSTHRQKGDEHVFYADPDWSDAASSATYGGPQYGVT